jgi:hypothetical protein
MRAIAIGIPFIRRSGIDAQAQAHFNRVIADGGLVPSGLSGVNAFFNTIKTIYGTSDINTAISVGLDPQVLGYKLGAGSGTTLGQAAQKLYSPKDVFGGIGTGNAYWEGSGVTGNFIQSNTSAYNTNDIDIEVQASTVATTGDVSFVNISNGTSTTVDFFYSKTNGVIQFQYYTGGFRNSFAVATIADGDIFRVTRNATTGSIVFRKNGIILTTSGAQVAGVLDFVNTTIKIGQGVCKINYANFYIAGVLNKTFNPNQYTGANTWTSTTSEVWTVNRTGAGLADVVQTTAASQPLLLVHSGANYWFGSGVANNYVSTPNAAANQITGDIEIISKIDYKNNTTLQTIIDKSNGTAFNYSLYIDGSNVPKFIYSVLGSVQTAICSSNIGASFSGYIKVTRTFVNGVFKFFTSSDGITYTQLGTNISGTIGLLDSNSHPVTIGILQPSSFPFQGKISRATISNSIGGTPVVDFNPATYNASTSQTQWTSSTGEVWTINTGTATTGYKGVLVDRTIVQGNGISSFLSGFDVSNLPNNYSLYGANRLYTSTGSGNVFGASLGGDQFFHFYINSNTFIKRWSSGPDKDFGTTLNLLTYTGTGTGAGSVETMERNNAGINTVSNARPVKNSGVAVSVFASNVNGIFASNTTVNTLIIANSIDNSTPKTAMYNYIKLINNNAF